MLPWSGISSAPSLPSPPPTSSSLPSVPSTTGNTSSSTSTLPLSSDSTSQPPSFPAVLSFLSNLSSTHLADKTAWEIERAEMRARIALLEGEKKGLEGALRESRRRAKLLEGVLKGERSKFLSATNGKLPLMTSSGASSPLPTDSLAIPSLNAASIAALSGAGSALLSSAAGGIGSTNSSRASSAMGMHPTTTAGAGGGGAGGAGGVNSTANTGGRIRNNQNERQRGRDYLKQCLQEVAYLTSPTTLNPLAPSSHTIPQLPRPKKVLQEGGNLPLLPSSLPPISTTTNMTQVIPPSPPIPISNSLPPTSLPPSTTTTSTGIQPGIIRLPPFVPPTPSTQPLSSPSLGGSLSLPPPSSSSPPTSNTSTLGSASDPDSIFVPLKRGVVSGERSVRSGGLGHRKDVHFSPTPPSSSLATVASGEKAETNLSGLISNELIPLPSSPSLPTSPLPSLPSLPPPPPPSSTRLTAIFAPSSDESWKETLKEAGKMAYPSPPSSDGEVFEDEELEKVGLGEEGWEFDDDDDEGGGEGKKLKKRSEEDGEKRWECVKTLRSHLDSIRTLSLFLSPTTPSTLTLLSAGSDLLLKIWSLPLPLSTSSHSPELEPITTLRHHTSPITSLTYSYHSQRIYAASLDGVISVWKLPGEGHETYERDEKVRELNLGTWEEAKGESIWGVVSLQKSKEGGQGEWVVTVGADGLVRVWDSEKGECVRSWDYDGIGGEKGKRGVVPTCLKWVGGSKVVVGYKDSSLKVWDVEKGEEVVRGKRMEKAERSDGTPRTQVNEVCWIEERDWLVVAYEDKYLRTFDLATGECLNSSISHLDGITSLSYNSHLKILTTGSHDNSIRFWTVDTPPSSPSTPDASQEKEGVKWNCIQEISAHRSKSNEGVLDVEWCEEAGVLVSAGADGVVKVWC